MKQTDNVLLVGITVLLLTVMAVAFAGMVAADHGSPANFTVYPETTDDRSPDTTDGTYVMSSAGADAFESERGLEYVDYYWIESDQASFTDCDPDNARVFGIDRGNNNSGTQTDVDLLEHMKNHNVGDDRITLELYDPDDFGGEPINLNAPDATIAVLADCVENTGDAGWYQFQGFVNGTTYGGEYEEVYLDSHYFWIGDFDSEEEAREELGPPPSEAGDGDGDGEGDDDQTESTPEPESAATPTPDSADGAGDDTGDDGSGDEGSTDDGETSSAADDSGDDDAEAGGDGDADDATDDADDAGGDAGGDGDAGDATDDADDAAGTGGGAPGAGDSTPTPGDGAGFGGLVAVLAVLSVGLLVRRR